MATRTREVFDGLARDEAAVGLLVERVGDAIATGIDEYGTLSREALLAGVRHTITFGLAHGRMARLPDRQELGAIAAIIRERARQGLSVAAVLNAYHLGGQEFRIAVAEHALRNGVSPSDLIPILELVQRWLDAVTVMAATVHHEVGVETARQDEARIGAALRALLDESVSAEVANMHLVQLGLDPTRRYAALRGRVAEGVSIAEVQAAFGTGVVAIIERHDVVGLLDSLVDVPAELGTFGLGPFRRAGDLRASAIAAGRALTAATRLGSRGVHRLDRLRLRALAATEPEIGRIVRDRVLTPLRAKGRYGEDIWTSVVRYLEHGLRVEETAADMHVHPNTLRNRLAHFAAETGVDLRHPADIAEAWWVATAYPHPFDDPVPGATRAATTAASS
ncbi:MAG TPA: helix-turn-helix domain-containing protein [Streptosporangiales bacterium]